MNHLLRAEETTIIKFQLCPDQSRYSPISWKMCLEHHLICDSNAIAIHVIFNFRPRRSCHPHTVSQCVCHKCHLMLSKLDEFCGVSLDHSAIEII